MPKMEIPDGKFRLVYDLNGEILYVYFIESKQPGVGNTQALIKNWLESGIDVRVVWPNATMCHILKKFGFHAEWGEAPGRYTKHVKIWRK